MNLDYIYPVAEAERIVDGDTYWLRLDVGFRQTQMTNIRLLGWDTPELFSSRASAYEKKRAGEAQRYVREWFDEHMDTLDEYYVYAQTEKDPDNFGRWLARIWCQECNTDLGIALREQNLATPWPQRWREVHDTEG